MQHCFKVQVIDNKVIIELVIELINMNSLFIKISNIIITAVIMNKVIIGKVITIKGFIIDFIMDTKCLVIIVD